MTVASISASNAARSAPVRARTASVVKAAVAVCANAFGASSASSPSRAAVTNRSSKASVNAVNVDSTTARTCGSRCASVTAVPKESSPWARRRRRGSTRARTGKPRAARRAATGAWPARRPAMRDWYPRSRSTPAGIAPVYRRTPRKCWADSCPYRRPGHRVRSRRIPCPRKCRVPSAAQHPGRRRGVGHGV